MILYNSPVGVVRFVLGGVFLSAVMMGVFGVGQARADALSDLRTTLQGLNANAEVKGTLDVQSVKVDAKKDKTQDGKQAPSAQLQLAIDAGQGLGIHLSPALLQQINAEQRAHANDPEKATPTSDLLDQVGPMEVEKIVSAAPGLLLKLDGAGSPTITATQKNGAPLSELRVDVPLKASKKDSSDISDYKGTMTVLLDAQGMPLSYQQTYHAKFCKFFLCVKVDETRDVQLRVVDGRLVAVSYSDETRQSGLGQDGDTKKIYTLTLNDATDTKAGK